MGVLTGMSSRRMGFRFIASIALLLLCLSLVDPADLLQALKEINIYYFLVAFLLNAVGTVLVKAWIAHLTMRASGLSLSFSELVRINLIARFYTLALPRGASAAIRWHHYRKGGSGHAAAALLVFENMVSILTLFLSAAVVLMFEARQAGEVAQMLISVTWLGVGVSVVALLPFINKSSAMLLRRILSPLLERPGRLGVMIGRFLEAVSNYHDIPVRMVGSIVFASIIGYLFFVLAAWVLAEGMGLGVGLAAIAWVRSVTLIVALVPVTIAGIGLREVMLIALLRDYGVLPSVAFAYAVTSFAIQLILGVFGAILEFLQVMKGDKNMPAGRSGEEV